MYVQEEERETKRLTEKNRETGINKEIERERERIKTLLLAGGTVSDVFLTECCLLSVSDLYS